MTGLYRFHFLPSSFFSIKKIGIILNSTQFTVFTIFKWFKSVVLRTPLTACVGITTLCLQNPFCPANWNLCPLHNKSPFLFLPPGSVTENLGWIAEGRTKQHLEVLEREGLFHTRGLRGEWSLKVWVLSTAGPCLLYIYYKASGESAPRNVAVGGMRSL